MLGATGAIHTMAHSDTPLHDKPAAPAPGEIVFLPLEEVARRCGLSRRTIYNRIDENQFPKPVNLSPRRIGFIEAEVTAWQTARIKERAA